MVQHIQLLKQLHEPDNKAVINSTDSWPIIQPKIYKIKHCQIINNIQHMQLLKLDQQFPRWKPTDRGIQSCIMRIQQNVNINKKYKL